MRFLLLVFILVPIIEIAIFMEVGGWLGVWPTLTIVVLTAVVGVKLLKQQGFKALGEIQQSLALGRLPAVEMAAAAQLVFAGGLLLTPGFVTDIIGFSLMVPSVRRGLASMLIRRWTPTSSGFAQNDSHSNPDFQRQTSSGDSSDSLSGRVIEGEFEEKSD